MKRGGGRRYYRPDDVELLKGIRHLLYDQGYTIKGVQKLLKTNGNKFVMAVATGDVATMEALVAANASKGDDPKVNLDEDQVVGRPKVRTSGRFFGFGGSANDDAPEISVGKGSVGKEDRALLQEACSIFWNASAFSIRCADRQGLDSRTKLDGTSPADRRLAANPIRARFHEAYSDHDPDPLPVRHDAGPRPGPGCCCKFGREADHGRGCLHLRRQERADGAGSQVGVVQAFPNWIRRAPG